MKQNVGSTDRILRVIAGLVIFALYFLLPLSGVVGIVSLVIGGILILTGVAGFCPLYLPFHISTRKV